jgi:hypothetical protein
LHPQSLGLSVCRPPSSSNCTTRDILDVPPCTDAAARARWQRLLLRARELVELLQQMPPPVGRLYLVMYAEQLAQHTMPPTEVPAFIDACLAHG